MKKVATKKTRGSIVFCIGIIIGLLYIFKVYPFGYTTLVEKIILSIWAYLGGLIALVTIGSGLCIIFLEEDEKSFYGE